jgi:hypothetical protein
MNRFLKIATWVPLIPQIKNLHNFHVIIQAVNTTFLRQHYKNINHDHNLQMFHTLYCRNKNTSCINKCVQVYKFTEIFIYFNPWWSWVNDDV